MNEETTEPQNQILKAIADLDKSLSEKIDRIEIRLDGYDIQFESIRLGIVQNSAAFDRLQAKVLNMNANLTELMEEVRQIRKKELV